jgi:fimbrial chaperone protein
MPPRFIEMPLNALKGAGAACHGVLDASTFQTKKAYDALCIQYFGIDSRESPHERAQRDGKLGAQSNRRRKGNLPVNTRLALFLLAVVTSFSVTAGSLSVTPIRIELSSAQRSVALTVRNDGDQPTVVQAQLVAWSQADNDDRLEPTTDILASPPIFTVTPGASQVLRIALRTAPDAARERSYRVLVTEVPGKPDPAFTGAQFALKISLPIFVAASTAKTTPQLEWSGVRTAKGDLALTAVNTGGKHIQVQAIEVTSAASEPDARFAGLWYILPGQRRTVTIKPSDGHTIAADRVRVKAETDAGPLAADVVLEQR